MWTIISFIVLIAVILVLAIFLFKANEKIDDHKSQIKYWKNSNQTKVTEKYDLFEKIEVLIKQRDCSIAIAKTLHSRIKNYSVGITRFKKPDTDIRVLQVYARDELAIELQKDGLITYKMSEHWREDLKETEVKVTASINVNKIKP
jgi:hypothetical protein